MADDDGRTCYRNLVMDRPIALCRVHRIQVALVTVPDLLREQLAAAELGELAPASQPQTHLVTRARPLSVAPLLRGVHDSVVYFVVNGGRVKIGFTTNLKSRLGSLALRADSVLLVLAGGPDLERALHAQFSAYRDSGTEWFEMSPEIFRFVSNRASRPVGRTRKPVERGTGAGSRRRIPTAAPAHINAARQWLSEDPDLTGVEIARRLRASDSYGRRVRRAALGTGPAGPEHPTTHATVGQGGEGYN
ncbi:GIY-YIG nuclease family protein [Streptomyces formicae]